MDEVSTGEATIEVARGGEWMEPEQLRRWALEQMGDGPAKEAGSPGANRLTMDLAGVDYLDAATLQILLAIEAELQPRGGHLRLIHASEQLQQWFDFAGAGNLIQAGAGTATAESAPPRGF